jgi:hypothetical protein
MWQPLYDPPFILQPKHAAVFRLGGATLSDLVGWERWEDEWDGMGIAVFDSLTQPQKQAAILMVAKALLDPTCEAPDVTAVVAATVDAIYRNLEALVETEIGDDTKVRRMLLEAADEIEYWNEADMGLPPGEEPERPPAPDSDDTSEWAEIVEALLTEILDDYDHSMEKNFMDMPPEQAASLKEMMRIDPDYFVAIVEDPTPQRIVEIRQEIKALLY